MKHEHPDPSLPMISVVMPSFNQDKFIRESIGSVLSQDYPNLELIVVDGGSTDNTVSILESYGTRIRWVSEKDEGQSDALNKGIGMAKAEIIGWLNADDLYHRGALRAVGNYFKSHPEKIWMFGPCSIINEHGHEIRRWISWYKAHHLDRYSYDSLLIQNIISQMGVFMKRQAVLEAGGFNKELHYTMDYDLWLRLGKMGEPGHLKQRLGKFRMYSTTKSVTGFYKQFAENLEIAKKYGPDRHWPLFLHRLHRIKIVMIYTFMRVIATLTHWKERLVASSKHSKGSPKTL